MKNLFIYMMSLLAIASFSCNGGGAAMSSEPSISGKIENAENIKIFVDKVFFTPDDPNVVVGSADADASGNFKMQLNDLEPAFYRIRAGQKSMMFVMNGDEKAIKFTGNLNNMERFDGVSLDGAPAASEFIANMKDLMSNSLGLEQAKKRIQNTKYPIVAMATAINAFRNNPKFVDIHKQVLNRFKLAYPKSKYARLYGKFVSDMDKPKEAVSKGPVSVGQPAPDIALPDVNGKTIKLSDLKGKLVLLDFWASWCGPCRRENPNVVKIYNKYKKQGFTVYSVSLDGVDGRTKARLEQGGRSVDDYVASQKKRWLAAIAQDKLSWKNHVSDLKKWDSAPVRTYGVTGIPKSFLIGRDGKVVEIGLRGAHALEEAIKKHL